MAKKMGNFIYVPREIFEVDKFGREPYSKREAFLDLVQMAAYEDTETFVNGYRYERSRGDVIVSKSFLSKRWGWSVDKVRRYTTYLERNGWCKCRRDDQCNQPITLISIVSYDVYQGGTTTPDTTDNTTPATTSGSTPDTQYKEKEKGTKNKEKRVTYPEEVERIYALYPGKAKRPEGNEVALKTASKDKDKIKKMLESGEYTEESLSNAIKRYIKEANPAYLKLFQSFLNQVPDYGEADSQLFSSPQVAPAPSSKEEDLYNAMHPTKEKVNEYFNRYFLPQHPMKPGESREEYKARTKPFWDADYKSWIERRVDQVNNKY